MTLFGFWHRLFLRSESNTHTVVAVTLVAAAMLLSTHGMLAATPDFPLKRGTNPRYLVDQNDRPFLINGDAAWSLIAQLTREEAEQYLINRRRKGFNAIIVNLLEHQFAVNAPANRYGHPPFSTPGDYATPNSAYFEHVDWVLKKAAENSIVVFLTPSNLGFQGGAEGWYSEMVANGSTKLRDYGRFLGQRYQNFDNIVWVNAGNFNPPNKGVVNAIAEGILEFDTRHLHTAHCAPETSAIDYWGSEAWFGINNTLSQEQPHTRSRQDYSRIPAVPFFLIESNYENEFGTTQQQVRQQAYWSIFCGSCGHFAGNNPIWYFGAGWELAIDGGGSADVGRLRKLLDSRPWWTFVPDTSGSIVLAGDGNPGNASPLQDFVTAERIPDGNCLWVYVKGMNNISVAMSQISGEQVQAWWYDPRTGTANSIGQFPNTGVQVFVVPGGDSSKDWVLVLDAVTANFVAPGKTTFQIWRTSHFSASQLLDGSVSGELSDPDGDGRSNLLEYALYSDPTVPDIHLDPLVHELIPIASEKFLSLTYTRRDDASDLSFGAVASGNLQVWSPQNEATLRDDGFTKTVRATDVTSQSGTARRFMRLEVSLSP